LDPMNPAPPVTNNIPFPAASAAPPFALGRPGVQLPRAGVYPNPETILARPVPLDRPTAAS